MAEDLDQIERVLKRLREAGKRDDQMEALLGRINVALSEIADAMNKPKAEPADNSEAIATALSRLQVPAPTVNMQPVLRADWKRLHVAIETNGRGEMTGMTLTRTEN
jgi:hypothetical protein